MARLQSILLEIAADIRDALGKEGIPFYVIGGAAIGCVREGKLVPWDDDIDLAVDRKYHDRVGPALEKNLPPGYLLEHPGTEANMKGHWRVVKKDTTLIRDPHDRFCKSICVEIFDLMDVPDAWLPRKLTNLLFRFHHLLNIGVNYVPHTIGKFFMFLKRGIQRGMIWLGKHCKSSYTATLNRDFLKETVKKEYLGTPKMMEINGIMLPFPEDTDSYLKICYGQDYMTPPPEIDRDPPYLVMSATDDW